MMSWVIWQCEESLEFFCYLNDYCCQVIPVNSNTPPNHVNQCSDKLWCFKYSRDAGFAILVLIEIVEKQFNKWYQSDRMGDIV